MESLYLKEILHLVSQGLLYPTILCLLLLVLYGVFTIGSLIVELLTERSHFKVVMPKFLNEINDASVHNVVSVIEQSELLDYQKRTLVTLFENRLLPEEARWALAKRLIEEADDKYGRIAARTDYAAKVAPMLGLMGTLIPLGPGIVALGQGDTTTLASSLLVAFDTTVAGLVVAAVCLFVSKVRKRWYKNYLSALKAASTTLLEKIDALEKAEKRGAGADTSSQAAFPSAYAIGGQYA